MADGDVVSLVTIRIPGIALDGVGGARLKVTEGHVGFRCVASNPRVGTLHDHDQGVKHCIVNWIPVYHNGVTAGGTGMQIWGHHHCRERKNKSIFLTTGGNGNSLRASAQED